MSEQRIREHSPAESQQDKDIETRWRLGETILCLRCLEKGLDQPIEWVTGMVTQFAGGKAYVTGKIEFGKRGKTKVEDWPRCPTHGLVPTDGMWIDD